MMMMMATTYYTTWNASPESQYCDSGNGFFDSGKATDVHGHVGYDGDQHPDANQRAGKRRPTILIR